MSFLGSLVNIVSSFALQVTNGFIQVPITKLRTGTIFTEMQTAINFVDQAGKYQLGQGFGSNSVLSRPSFQESPDYRPQETVPPRAFPTAQTNGYTVPLGMNDASMYRMSAEAIRVLKMFEGLHQRPYKINGKTYIGYGHQLSDNSTTAYVSETEADSMLFADISAAERAVKGALSGQTTQGIFDGLCDFAFTVSGSKFKGSTVVQKVNSGDIAGACTDLAQWCYSSQNGVVAKIPHLAARRTHNVHWMTMPIDPLPPPGA
jgi:lysozyme